MRYNPLIVFFFSLIFPAGLIAQSLETDVYAMPPDEPVVNDTSNIYNQIFHTPTETVITTDTIISGENVISANSDSTKTAFKPDAQKALWLGAVIPGFGQIVNKKYWKLPIVYGGFMGCGFAITWFSNEYQFYRIAYRDITDNDPTTRSHLDYLEARGATIEQVGGISAYTTTLNSYKDNYRRYRDLSILVSILYYGLTILEAYVDAELYDYDINPDLTMRFQPTIINNDVVHTRSLNEYDTFGQTRAFGQSNAIGLQWSIRLK